MVLILACAFCAPDAVATPANKAALGRHYDSFLARGLNDCSTCHQRVKLAHPAENLQEFPHNAFGKRLRLLGEELHAQERNASLAARLQLVAREDSDGDSVANEMELLLGHQPGDVADTPSAEALTAAVDRFTEFEKFMASYRWRPFEPVQKPAVPQVKATAWSQNAIDRFVAEERERHGLTPQPTAAPGTWLRRVYLDLIGLSPTPADIAGFEADHSQSARDGVIDRLLADPRYGERWGRHWMDVWRYSDWAGWSGGNQIRDSKPHIWRWRDWIVESLNQDKGYDRMIVEMLAADEVAPEDPQTLRATGFLVRNYKMLSREQWMEDTIKHTSQAFFGVTVGCAKCHDHMYDPVSQREYYQMRAIFEPHDVRTDRLPGQLDVAKDGLVRTYDAKLEVPTWLYFRGDERQADTNRVVAPGVPAALGGRFHVEPVSLPLEAYSPDQRAFVVRDLVAASARAIVDAAAELKKIAPDKAAQKELAQSTLAVAKLRYASLLATLQADAATKHSSEWTNLAIAATSTQRTTAAGEAKHTLLLAQQARNTAAQAKDKASQEATVTEAADRTKLDKAVETAVKNLEEAEKTLKKATTTLAEFDAPEMPTPDYKRRGLDVYPATSTGRRLAFAKWIANPSHPLTARVAMNHLWLRHFGRGIVPSVADFGAGGRKPSHPQLLDWLAAEFMEQGWSMKAMHRLMLTSQTYSMASTPNDLSAQLDPDNIYLWRMNSRRMEAELVRDNVLYLSGQLDPTIGGPEVDHQQGLTSKRRSLYLRLAAEKEVEFLKIFDGPSVDECYERKQTVMPQQALALANSPLALEKSRQLAEELSRNSAASHISAHALAREVFLRILARPPTPEEERLCLEFLAGDAAPVLAGAPGVEAKRPDTSPGEEERTLQRLLLVLFNHHDFVTIR